MAASTASRLIDGTFNALFSNFGDFLKICWAWFSIQVLATLLLGREAADLVDGPAFDPQQLAGSLALLALSVVSGASIAVAWHRRVLLGERPGAVHLAFGRREVAYAWRLAAIALLGGAFALSLSLLRTLAEMLGGTVLSGIVAIAYLVAFVLSLPLWMRLMLVLPPAAFDERLGLREAFAWSAGLGWPMVGASLFAALFVALPVWLLQFVAGMLGGFVSTAANIVLDVVLLVVGAALQIGILAGGYYILRERQMAQGAGPPAA